MSTCSSSFLCFASIASRWRYGRVHCCSFSKNNKHRNKSQIMHEAMRKDFHPRSGTASLRFAFSWICDHGVLCAGETESKKNKLERNSISQSNDVNVKAFDVSVVKLICFAFENKGKSFSMDRRPILSILCLATRNWIRFRTRLVTKWSFFHKICLQKFKLSWKSINLKIFSLIEIFFKIFLMTLTKTNFKKKLRRTINPLNSNLFAVSFPKHIGRRKTILLPKQSSSSDVCLCKKLNHSAWSFIFI